MPGRNDPIGPYQPLPFAPASFYAVPYQWLRDVCATGDLDTRQLLLAMNNGLDALVVFPPERNEAYWTRANPAGQPNVVSHPTYLRYLRALLADGKLRVADDDATTASQVYVLADWPRFADAGRLYVPRAYIERRWPAWLGQSQWAPRAALLALLDKLAAEQAGAPAVPGQPLEVTAYVKELGPRARAVLPKAHVAGRVGDGLAILADLGLVAEVARSRANRSYRLRTDAFDHPPAWPLAEIAARCGLHLTQDKPWVALIRDFLQRNFWPVTRSAEVWAAIRRYAADAVTHHDAQAIGRLLAQRAARPGTGRQALHPRTVLKDYLAQRRRPWLYGAEFSVTLTSGASSASGLWLPVAAAVNLDATQLVVWPTWEGRLSHEDVLALLQHTRWFLRQQTARYVERLIELPLPLRPDRQTITAGLVLDGNHLHTALDYALPFRVTVEPAQAQPRLSLRCQFRVLPGRTAAVARQPAIAPV